MDLKDFKKRIPDVVKQTLTVNVYGQKQHEEKVKWFSEQMETGFVGYIDKPVTNGCVLTIYTSYHFKKFLDFLKPGVTCKNPRGREFVIESEPFVENHYMCVRANSSTWYCDTIYDKDFDYTAKTEGGEK